MNSRNVASFVLSVAIISVVAMSYWLGHAGGLRDAPAYFAWRTAQQAMNEETAAALFEASSASAACIQAKDILVGADNEALYWDGEDTPHD